MQFNNPLPRATQPRFAEGTALASNRDDRNNSKIWIKAQSNVKQDGRGTEIIKQLMRRLQNLRHVRAGAYLPPPAKNKTFFPFKIYQPSNVAQFGTGITFLASGVPSVCNIDATQPTNFTLTPPTVNPITDAWRFWAVRSGQVEIRPLYTLYEIGQEYSSDTGDVIADPNYWGWKYTINTNTDGINPLNLLYNGIAGGNDFDSQTDETFFPPLINCAAPSPFNYSAMFLWIEITPDSPDGTPPFVQINGAVTDSDPIDALPWPQPSPYIIPIGVISNIFYGADGAGNLPFYFSAEQFVFDHQVNLFPKGNGNFASGYSNPLTGLVLNFRGAILYDGSSLPLDLESQIFYPGDLISHQVGSGVGDIHQYLFTSPAPYLYEGYSDPTFFTQTA